MVEFFNKTDYEIDLELLNKIIDLTLKKENVNNAMFNVIFLYNDEIHKINKEYRNIDRPTDVISFALEDDKSYPKLDIRILGDIYISVDKIKSQALEYNHSERREISFLLVHGLLHLLGYDHMKEEEEKIMFSLQEEILNEAGIEK